jgi:hypothetical protein
MSRLWTLEHSLASDSESEIFIKFSAVNSERRYFLLIKYLVLSHIPTSLTRFSSDTTRKNERRDFDLVYTLGSVIKLNAAATSRLPAGTATM